MIICLNNKGLYLFRRREEDLLSGRHALMTSFSRFFGKTIEALNASAFIVNSKGIDLSSIISCSSSHFLKKAEIKNIITFY